MNLELEVYDIAEHIRSIADELEGGGSYSWQSEESTTATRMSAAAARSEMRDAFDRLAHLGGQFERLEHRLQWALTVHCTASLVLPVLDYAVERPGPGKALQKFGGELRQLADILSRTLMEPDTESRL